ncbi:MAG: hypothetical protein H7138_25475 [Myxococcales bacterium]|nr:hypothetical protein [Myxococcales bacterium]
MVKTTSLFVIALAALVGCSDDKPGDPPADGGNDTGPAYVMMHTVSSPEGRQNYVFASNTVAVGELDKAKGLEVSGPSRTFALGGAAFVADAETLSIRRFAIDGDSKLVPDGTVSFANFGITYFDTGFTLIDDEHAWYMASDVLKVIQFNPKTMEITGTVDMASVKHPTLQTYIDGGKKVGDYVFAAVWYYSDDDQSAYGDPEIKVAVISTSEMKIIKVITHPGCVMGAIAAKLANDDLIVAGDASTGVLNLFGKPAAPPNCLLRIKAGETELDPTFLKKLDDLTAPSVAGSRISSDATSTLLWARDPGTFPSIEEFYTSTRWTPYALDTVAWTATPIAAPGLATMGFPADTFVIDGVPHFTLASRVDGQPGGSLVRYEDGKITEEVLYTEWLQAVARVR